MAFIDNFNRADGPLVAPYTVANGTAEILNSQVVLTGAQPSAPRWVITKNGTADGYTQARLGTTNKTSAISRLYFRYVNLQNSLFANINYTNDSIELYSVVGNGFTLIASSPQTLTANNLDILRVEYTGSTVNVLFNGTTVITETVTDFQTATINGFGGTQNTVFIDDFEDSSGVASSITINNNEFEVFQLTSDTQGSVSLDLAITGTTAALERSINGGAFTTAIINPSASVTDTFTAPVGVNTVAYRFADDFGVTAQSTSVKVGKNFIVAGQSNASCWGLNNQTVVTSVSGVSPSLLGNDDVWKVLSDPYDRNTNQVDLVSDDGNNPGGSWVVQFANKHLVDYPDIPISFIPSNKGSTGIRVWQKDSTVRTNGLNLYESTLRRANILSGVESILWFQWERDANVNELTTRNDYVTLATQLFSDFNTDIAPRKGIMMVASQQINNADWDGNGTTTGQVAIRAAQQDLASAINYVYVTSATTSIDLDAGTGSDGLHFRTDSQIAEVSAIIYSSYKAQIIDGVNPPTVSINTIQDQDVEASSIVFIKPDIRNVTGRLRVTYRQISGTPINLKYAGYNAFFKAPENASTHTIVIGVTAQDDLNTTAEVTTTINVATGQGNEPGTINAQPIINSIINLGV